MKFEKIKNCLSTEISFEKKLLCKDDLVVFKENIPDDYKLRGRLTEAIETTQNRLSVEFKFHKSLKSRQFKTTIEANNSFAKSKQIINLVHMKEKGAWGDYFNLKEGKSQPSLIFESGIIYIFLGILIFGLFIFSFLKSKINLRMKEITYLSHFNFKNEANIIERKLFQERDEANDQMTGKLTLITWANKLTPGLHWIRAKKEKKLGYSQLSLEEEQLIDIVDDMFELLKEIYFKDIELSAKRKTNLALHKLSDKVELIDFTLEEKYIKDNLLKIKTSLKNPIYKS